MVSEIVLLEKKGYSEVWQEMLILRRVPMQFLNILRSISKRKNHRSKRGK
jgi:hypothetical protein